MCVIPYSASHKVDDLENVLLLINFNSCDSLPRMSKTVLYGQEI